MFHDWDNYFFMLGSAAASLIGLLFVVMTLTAELRPHPGPARLAHLHDALAVHFAVVLAVSAVALAPGLAPAVGAVLAIGALVGLGNAIRTASASRPGQTTGNKPHWSDFWFYGVAPAVI